MENNKNKIHNLIENGISNSLFNCVMKENECTLDYNRLVLLDIHTFSIAKEFKESVMIRVLGALEKEFYQ